MIHLIFGLGGEKTQAAIENLNLPDLTKKVVEFHVQAVGARDAPRLEEKILHFAPLDLRAAFDANPYPRYTYDNYAAIVTALPDGYIHDDRVLFFYDEFCELAGDVTPVLVDERPDKNSPCQKALKALQKRVVKVKVGKPDVGLSD